MRRGYKVRIYPNEEQVAILSNQFGAARWIYNFCLEWRSSAWKDSKQSVSKNKLIIKIADLKKSPETEWLKAADSQALQQSVINLDRGFQSFFSRRGRYPRFKNRRSRQSITYPQRVKVNRVDEVIYLPKVGWVKAMFHRPFQEGDVIKQVIVSKTETGKYFASLSLDNSKEAPEKADDLCENDVLGIDLGITDLMVASDGTKVPNPRFIKRAAKNLRRKQQSLSRKKKGSANRAKARLAVARAHERLANVRRDFQHKLSRQIVDESQAVVCETLKVKNMMKNRKLAKSIGDASWFSFVSKLEYKLEWAGKRLVKLDQWFPGSKTCSNCQTIVNKMPLDMRHWDCLSCGASHDRDINAALNHKAKGIEILKAEGLFVSAC